MNVDSTDNAIYVITKNETVTVTDQVVSSNIYVTTIESDIVVTDETTVENVQVTEVTTTENVYVTSYNVETVEVTTGNNLGQSAIQFQDEGGNLGTAGTITIIDFVGTPVSAVRVGSKLTVTISSTGGGAGTWGSITGTLSAQTDLQAALDAKVDGNSAIVAATKTKITYDTKGLVTAGADATTADIADSTNKRYVTDANLTVINNTSGVNTGDQDLSPYALEVDLTALEVRVDDLEDVVYSQTGFVGQALATWTGTGLVFDVIWPAYYIVGVRYDAGSDQVTLSAADPSNPRIDVIAVNATGAIVIPGDPAVAPVTPTVDNLTQLSITTVLINAGATTPSGITDEDIYKEHVEWTASSDNGTVDFDATTNPFAGTKHIRCGAFTNGQYLRFVDSVTNDITDYSQIKFYVSLRATFASTAGFILSFRNGATVVSSSVTITNGIYAFDRTDISGYQLIVIPISAFTFSSATFDRLNIALKGSNGTGFDMDNIILQGGIAGSSALQNAVTTITTDSGSAVSDQANDTFNILGLEGTVITASGKTISVKALPLITASGTDTYTGTVPTTLATNHVFRVKIPNANTGASTFNTIPLKKDVTTALAAGDLKTNGVYIFHYDGTNIQVIGLGGGGGGTWGSITGTLSSQTDLQTELDGKVNDTGNETIAGVKTFSSDPLIPDEAYGSGWNGVLEPPTKNAVYDQVELKSNIASPTFTGTPAAPTAAALTNTTQLATTAFVQQEVNGSNSYIANKISLQLFNSY